MKFLVDECLSPELTKLAQASGYGQSAHVVWLGRAGLKDWELKRLILKGDWTFVTKNSVDFRGSAERPGVKGQYADVTIHAGLICFNGPPGMDLDMQLEPFEQALDELEVDSDLVNQVLEIMWDDMPCTFSAIGSRRVNHNRQVQRARGSRRRKEPRALRYSSCPSVMAPRLAVETSRMYFASTPAV